MSAAPVPTPVTRDDFESKFRLLAGDIESAGNSARSIAVTVGAIGVVAVVAAAFFLGRRRGQRKSTVVEIRRV